MAALSSPPQAPTDSVGEFERKKKNQISIIAEPKEAGKLRLENGKLGRDWTRFPDDRGINC